MAMYFKEPFAAGGDKTTIPEAVQPDGSVSYTDGYGVDYELDPATPPGLNIERDKFNELMYQVTLALQQYQQVGFPTHITAADNGGVAYGYAKNATVRATNGNNYYSLIDSNTDVPPSSNWGLVVYATPVATGSIELWGFSTVKSGYVWLNGLTIGSAASGATGRANADTATLYAMLWTDYSNTVLPIQTSTGSASTRGANAAADFAANKRLPVPDYRGRSFFGLDNMGGASAAGRVTNGESGISGVTLGASGGLESVALTSNQNGQHAHNGTTNIAGDHYHTYPARINTSDPSVFQGPNINQVQNTSQPTNSAGSHAHTFTTDSSGLGQTHQNMPPAFIGGGFIMKL